MKKALKISGSFLAIVALFFIGFLAFMTIIDYQPEEKISLEIINPSQKVFNSSEPFTITTFNIGYGGLDDKENFFMDGGSNSRASSLQQVNKNLEGISDVLLTLKSDFYFLQEVDRKATRSFKVNELEYLAKILPTYEYSFAQNYLVSFVPVPIKKPHGQVDSGLVSFTNYATQTATRLALAGAEKWPVQIFELDRSMLEQRITLNNNKQLVLLNVHLSAYDKGGVVRKQQLTFIEEYVTTEYKKGNYIIIGGDFNHLIPTTNPSIFPTTESWPDWLQTIPEDFLTENFYWVADETIPTSRTIATSYTSGENFLSVIDGFLISDNVELLDVQGTDLQFKNSDHNPVTATFKLK